MGYTGGELFEPTYKRIGDHTEAILIEYSDELSYEDLLQEGVFALLRAAEGFDVERKLRFSTYATVAVKSRQSGAGSARSRPSLGCPSCSELPVRWVAMSADTSF